MTTSTTSPTPVRPRTRPALGVGLVLTSGVLFAVNGTVSKLILRAGLDVPHLAELRATGALVGLLALCLLLHPGPARLRISRRELPVLIGFGLTGFFLVPMLYFVAISRLPVGIALLFEYTAPLIVALWARFGQRQRVKGRLWVGLTLSLLGLAGVAQIWHRPTGRAGLDLIGVAAGLGAAGLLGFYYVLGARGAAGRDALSLTCWAFGVAALAGMIVRPWWTFPFGIFTRHSQGVPVWLLAIYLVLGGSIAAYLLVSAAMRHLPPTSVGIIGMVEPAIAGAVAWLVLGERLAPAQLAGGALILLGVALAETARATGPSQAPQLPPG